MTPTGEKDFLNANLELLCATIPQADCARLKQAGPTPEAAVVATQSGYPSLFAFGRYTYSRHDPVREARRLVSGEIPSKTEICVFYNFGLAYHVEAFLQAFPSARAIVIEPDVDWLVTALAARDLRHLLSDPRLTLAIDVKPPAVVHIIDDFPHSFAHVVKLRALAEKNSEYFARIDSQLGAMLSRREINANTLARFGHLWVRNLAENVELVANAPGVHLLSGAFEGTPALILAAGPSLDDVLPLLPRLREKLLVISVDTSTAHLAGALGKPVWILLPHAPDYRWMLDREDSPWYPSARLFRQSKAGDWAGVIQSVKEQVCQKF